MSLLNKKKDGGSGFQAFPAAKYLLEVKAATWTTTNAGTGHYLKVELAVVKGPQKGRKFWSNLNLDNPNSQAEEIARNEAMDMIQGIYGEKRDVDSVKQLVKLLVGKSFTANVGIEENPGYSPQNKINSVVLKKAKAADQEPADQEPKKEKKKGKKKKGKKKDQGW